MYGCWSRGICYAVNSVGELGKKAKSYTPRPRAVPLDPWSHPLSPTAPGPCFAQGQTGSSGKLKGIGGEEKPAVSESQEHFPSPIFTLPVWAKSIDWELRGVAVVVMKQQLLPDPGRQDQQIIPLFSVLWWSSDALKQLRFHKSELKPPNVRRSTTSFCL